MPNRPRPTSGGNTDSGIGRLSDRSGSTRDKKRPPNAERLSGRPGWYRDPVVLEATDPKITVIGRLTGKPTAATPRPRYETVNRPGRTALVRYTGHDPHELTIPMALDKGGDAGVEKVISLLEDLMERHSADGEPPVIRVEGQGVPHTGLKWRVQDVEENEALTRYLPDGRRERFAFTLHLIEHVTDRQLARSIVGGKGLRAVRTTRTRQGETLYDIARRAYGDPSRASDLQKANPQTRFGQVFRAGVKLKLP